MTTIEQSTRGVPGSDEDGDAFGQSVVLGDIDRDGYADLVVGAPGDNNDRGQVTLSPPLRRRCSTETKPGPRS